jgi:type IV pilus assembly protein PilN
MIRINLLPAEERSAKSQGAPRVSWTVWPIAGLSVLVMAIVGTTTVQTSKIKSLETDITRAESQTASLAPQIQRISDLGKERADMDLRMSVLTRLQSSRYLRVQIMDELSRQLPDHVWLTDAKEKTPGNMLIEGVTFSNLMVSDFMQRLEASPIFDNVDLVISEKGALDDRDVVKFTMTAHVSGDLGATAPQPVQKQTLRKRES